MRFIVASDVHLGHRRTPVKQVIKGLKKCIFNLEVLSKIDAVFIPGDLIDRELSFSSHEALEINEFLAYMLRLCMATKTAIRLLHGTPSHDWGQGEHIKRIADGLKLDVDLRYHDTFVIERDPTLDVVIGYVPDEYKESYHATEKEVEERLATLGAYPDLFFLHGFFDFQVPKLNIKTFDSKKWSRWAKAIYIGHDHNHKSQYNITIPGSFDRGSHGEEDPKGYLLVEKIGNEYKTTFKVNPYAQPYVTLDLTEKTDEEALEYVNGLLKNQHALDNGDYFTSGRLKLKLPSNHRLAVSIKEWRKEYPKIGFDVEAKKVSIDIIEKNEQILREHNVINITKDNIGDMLNGVLKDAYGGDDLSHIQDEIELLRRAV